MSVSPRDLLFYAGGGCLERFGTLVWRPRHAMDAVPTSTRTGSARLIGSDGVLRSVSANRPRVSYPLVDGVRRPALSLEAARTNLALHSADISNAAWDVSGAAKSAATSLVLGGTAQTITSTGSGAEALRQTIGTLTATPETFSVLVENVDAAVTRLGIYDSTAPGFVANARITWATGELQLLASPQGSAQSARAEYMGVGPNGGDVYLIQIAGTPSNAGNARQVWFYPGGQLGNTQAAIVHYGQHEAGNSYASSLIVTGASSAPRNAEALTVPVGFVPQEVTYYVDLLDRGDVNRGTTPTIFNVGGQAVGATTISLIGTGSDGFLKWSWRNAGTLFDRLFGSGGLAYGDRIETICQIHKPAASWIMTVYHAIDGGPPVLAGTTTIGAELAAAFGVQQAGIGCAASTASAALSPVFSVKAAAGAHLLPAMRAVFP